MTPAARLSAAIEILDRWLAGMPVEKALVNWARASRFAGSGDRNAVRDLVFDAVRCRRSHAALGGGETGRGLVLGGVRARGDDPAALFTGVGHAPAAITEDDAGTAPSGNAALDCPDWLADELRQSLGDRFAPVMEALRHRAPVFLRATRPDAARSLAQDGIATVPHPLAASALQVTDGARKIQTSATYLSGGVELQDVASQAVIADLPLADGQRVLDFCAGGGGKALAMAARARVRIDAHDAAPGRMADLAARAKRAKVTIGQVDTATALAGTYDLVLADVPCSGSGSWRRAPEGKWALTADRLTDLVAIQAGILDQVAGVVRAGGHLAYVTCSVLMRENAGQIAAFQARHSGWDLVHQRSLTPLDGGDGFHLSSLRKQG
ncbi:RsmB/NOP family class I SAM-dependent RNA methyltransferase [Falsirhodobacter halotolerans]|uniref:RsmB/NOP family class I SAM-dependent RNA methyltransferase n=1 Tax=Falsirhodobacter halotolerans TaxID=1146892 RepID=UPI001FD4CD6A|nr:RsmB/NOP family class I SAM-dependent RNA methyltransferase [Falsirhodobacter halotolerans]MCJ8139451.1 RsmB/NOP family class I SAM-dependent RNA methyltransferase [Falsirhodobacter halotolerans]